MAAQGEASALAKAWGPEVRVGGTKLRVGVDLKEMADSSALLNDVAALRERLYDDGFLLIRGLLDRAVVQKARAAVLAVLSKDWDAVDKSASGGLEAGVASKKARDIVLTGYTPATHHKDMTALVEGPRIADFFRSLFGAAPATYHRKWIRVKARGEYTGEHSDYVRFAAARLNLFTCWVPLGDYTPRDGTLAICEGSHMLASYPNAANGDAKGASELPCGFHSFRRKAVWKTASFKMGDALIFNIKAVHASTVNETDRLRLSVDTRWCVAVASSRSALRVFGDRLVDGLMVDGPGRGSDDKDEEENKVDVKS